MTSSMSSQWDSEKFGSTQSVGIAGDDTMYHILVGFVFINGYIL